MALISLPQEDGSISPYRTIGEPVVVQKGLRFSKRIAYAAAHIVSEPLRSSDPWDGGSVDWDRTMAFRRHLWSLGFRIAEAMDTSQRGMGFSWSDAKELIRRSIGEAAATAGADLASGAGTDHVDLSDIRSLDDVTRAYEEQLSFIEGLGGRAIIMASRALAHIARSPDDYVKVYSRIIAASRQKVILHWLGPMFDPALEGYWGSKDFATSSQTVVALIKEHAKKIEGIKISLLEKQYEISLRRRLPPGVVMFTGDDFNYAELIAGDEQGYSHALLGIFDPIAPVAALALSKLDQNDVGAFRQLLDPTVALSRRIFEAPTQYYKAGVVFLAWLNGHQDHFTMLGGMQSARGIVHYADIYRLADRCGLLSDPDMADTRMRALLNVHGIN